MAVNKNFVVKNGLEVNNDLIMANSSDSRVGIGTSVPHYTLHAFGGIGATSLHVAGVSTFLSDVRITGVTTLASAGGITTTGGDFYVGGDLYVLDDVVYDEVSGRNLNITGIGTINRVDVSKDINVTGVSTFTGISTFGKTVHIDKDLSVGAAATIAGDLSVSGDISFQNVGGSFINITGVGTITRLNTTNINVSGASTFTGIGTFVDSLFVGKDIQVAGASTFTGITTFGNSVYVDKDVNIGAGATVVGTLTVGGDLNVTGDLSYDEVTGRNINITGVGTITRLNTTDIVSTSSTITRFNFTDAVGTSATITQLNATDAVISGVLTATNFLGSAQVAISSEGTYMGAGASVLNFTSSTGQAIEVTPSGTSGIATIQIKPGASLGLAIALGG